MFQLVWASLYSNPYIRIPASRLLSDAHRPTDLPTHPPPPYPPPSRPPSLPPSLPTYLQICLFYVSVCLRTCIQTYPACMQTYRHTKTDRDRHKQTDRDTRAETDREDTAEYPEMLPFPCVAMSYVRVLCITGDVRPQSPSPNSQRYVAVTRLLATKVGLST